VRSVTSGYFLYFLAASMLSFVVVSCARSTSYENDSIFISREMTAIEANKLPFALVQIEISQEFDRVLFVEGDDLVFLDLSDYSGIRIEPIRVNSRIRDFSMSPSGSTISVGYSAYTRPGSDYLSIVDVDSGVTRYLHANGHAIKGGNLVDDNRLLYQRTTNEPEDFSTEEIAGIASKPWQSVSSLGGTLSVLRIDSGEAENVESCDGDVAKFLISSSARFYHIDGLTVINAVVFMTEPPTKNSQTHSLGHYSIVFSIESQDRDVCVSDFQSYVIPRLVGRTNNEKGFIFKITGESGFSIEEQPYLLSADIAQDFSPSGQVDVLGFAFHHGELVFVSRTADEYLVHVCADWKMNGVCERAYKIDFKEVSTISSVRNENASQPG